MTFSPHKIMTFSIFNCNRFPLLARCSGGCSLPGAGSRAPGTGVSPPRQATPTAGGAGRGVPPGRQQRAPSAHGGQYRPLSQRAENVLEGRRLRLPPGRPLPSVRGRAAGGRRRHGPSERVPLSPGTAWARHPVPSAF